MVKFITRRLFWIVVTLLIVSMLTFGLVFVSGDPAQMLVPVRPGQQPKPEQVERIRVQYGLDQPIHVQYLKYMGSMLRGDLGDSWYFHRPVIDLLVEKFPTTAMLAVLILFTALLIGLPLGIIAAIKRNSLVDRSIIVIATIVIAMPSFFLALIFIYVFAFQLQWLPFGGLESPKHVVMPVLAVAIPMSVGYALFLRTNMLNAAGAEYSRTARSKGLGRWRVNFKHVLPNALIPVVTLASLDMAFLLTGIVLIERVFSIPGIGLQVLTATQQRDIPVVMGSVFFGAILIGAGNLIADILVARLDPRIRLGD